MNAGHDLGGKQGLGAIAPEAETQEPIFHADWERRVFALTLATGMLGQWNIDESRHARERQHPVDYISNSYYENWLAGIEKLLLEKNLLERQELQSGEVSALSTQGHSLRVPNSNDAVKIMSSGGPTQTESDTKPVFTVGDKVRVRKLHTEGHTRSPSYTQGSIGEVAAYWGSHVYPDKNAEGYRIGEHLYSVRFTADALWGSHSENVDILVDLWEPYLERVAELGYHA